MAYKVQLEDRKNDELQVQSKKKVLAFHTFSDTEKSDDDEDEENSESFWSKVSLILHVLIVIKQVI